jgi:ubiquinone biosynthesis monooxygenase Coq7
MSRKRVTAEDRLPGDPTREQVVDSIIRVDHAGEYGATRIYAGQLAVLGRTRSAPALREMAAQEKEHLAHFEKLVADRRVRPTALSPLWHVAGFALGAATALMGERAAMACTEAVEEVIDEHYARQAEALGEDEAELRAAILRYRDDEIAHRDLARAEGAADAPGHELITSAVKLGSRLAIWLSSRL